MFYSDENHEARFREALALTGAIKEDGHIEAYFGASLYLLTGLPYVYGRAKKFLGAGYIDFGSMLAQLALSSGEEIAVSLAGNLYNGSFFAGYTPLDIISTCDGPTVQLACSALLFRKSRVMEADIAA